jgi:hypothetical protein
METKGFSILGKSERGFSVWGVVLLIALIAFIVLAAVKVLSVLAAVIGFVVIFAIIVIIALLPDIIRYAKISSM